MSKEKSILSGPENIFVISAGGSLLSIAYSPDLLNEVLAPLSITFLSSLPSFLNQESRALYRMGAVATIFVASTLGADLNCESPYSYDAFRICLSNMAWCGAVISTSYLFEDGVDSAIDKVGKAFEWTKNYIAGTKDNKVMNSVCHSKN